MKLNPDDMTPAINRIKRARGQLDGVLRMLEEGRPHLVVAFFGVPQQLSRGTANMVAQARKAGLPVIVVEVLAC